MKRAMALGLAAATIILAGCGGKTAPGAGGSNGGAGGKVIKIGLIAPLTGDVKTFGESSRDGMMLALEQAGNKAGDYTIETVVGDDRNDVNEGTNLATKFITQDGVKAIIGSVTSKVSIPVASVADSSKVVVISGTATAEKMTIDDNGKRRPFAFRAGFIDPVQGKVGAKFAVENLKVKSAAVLYDKGNDYTVGLAEAFKKSFEELGGKVVAWEAYSQDDKDFSAVLTNVAAKKPELLYLPDYYQKVSLIANGAKSKGLNVPMIGGDGWDSADLDYATMAGNYFTNHYSNQDPRPEVQKFVADFKAKYNREPDAFAALEYDATKILLKAIETANSNDPEKIREAMQNLTIDVVGGKISFDKNGNPVKPVTILQVQADKTSKFVTSVTP